jgi:hypothetical protein
MAQQLHRSSYGMVVIVTIGNMNFLPIMKTAMRRPAVRQTHRSHMHNAAGKSTRTAAHRCGCGGKTISGFAADLARPDPQ